MFLRHVIVFSFIALLAGCAGFGARESVQGQGNPAQWNVYKQQMTSLDGWQINGKIGIRAPKDSGSGTLFWLQRQDYYDIRLSGPLGRGAARLTGRPAKCRWKSPTRAAMTRPLLKPCSKSKWAGNCRCPIWPGGFAGSRPRTAKVA